MKVRAGWLALLVLGCETTTTVPAAPDLGVVDAAAPAVGAPDPQLWTADEALALVDPFLGTGGLAFGYAAETPAAQWPLGMVRLGPDTTEAGIHPDFHHFSGYHYDDPHVRGFSHTHFVGTGAPDYGNLRVLPLRSAPETPWLAWAAMDKATEIAHPGSYRVQLPVEGVGVELTAGLRAGLHRYTFETPGVLVFDAAAGVKGIADEVDLNVNVTGGTLEGRVQFSGSLTGRDRPFDLFFSAQMDPAPSSAHEWDHEGQRGVVLGVSGTVTLRVGVSYVDLAGAQANLAEVAGDFEAVEAAATEAWRAKLARARVAGGTAAQRTIFATAQYHTYGMPTRFDDQDGRYRGLDGEVHQMEPGVAYYTDLSLWDTFRTLHPWWELVDEDTERDVLRTLMHMRADGGYFPRWPAALSYASSMMGTSADALIAGGHAKGIDGIDYADAFEGVWDTASGPTEPGSDFGGRSGIEAYLELGYVPVEVTSGSVSKTVEYAYNDGILAEFARRLGRPEAAALEVQAGSYAALWDPEQRLFAPRHEDGTFDRVRATQSFGIEAYVEGSPNHWKFNGLHQPEAFAELFGGTAGIVEALDELFELGTLGHEIRSTVAPDPYYWHGNEPMLHAAWMYGLYGEPDRLARWVRAIQRVIYTTGVDGLPGNDDGGTMSAWYLFASSGLYPVAGTDRYIIGPPLFPHVALETAGGTLHIVAPGASDARRHVRGVFVDGVPFEGAVITHEVLLAADELRFVLE
jgi:predicted alpha-1,2-mannosidase